MNSSVKQSPTLTKSTFFNSKARITPVEENILKNEIKSPEELKKEYKELRKQAESALEEAKLVVMDSPAQLSSKIIRKEKSSKTLQMPIDDCTKQFEQSMKKFTNIAQDYFIKGENSYQKNKLTEAILYYKKACQLAPKQFNGELQFEEEESKQIEQVQELISQDQVIDDSIKKLLRQVIKQGLEQEKQDQFYNAIMTYDEAYEIAKEWSFQNKESDKAIVKDEIHSELKSYIVEIYCLKGLALFHLTRNSEGNLCFQKANQFIAKWEQDLQKEATLQLANSKLFTNHNSEAIENFSKVIEKNNQAEDSNQNSDLEDISLQVGKSNKKVKIKKERTSSVLNIGDNTLNKFKNNQNLQALYLANVVQPKNSNYLVQFAKKLKEAKLREDAKKQFEQAIQVNPKCEEAYLNLGLIEEENYPEKESNLQKSIQEAIKWYDKGSSFESFFRKGKLFVKLMNLKTDKENNLQNAIQAFTAAIKLSPSNKPSYFIKAQLNYMANNFIESFFDFDFYLTLDDQNIEALYGKGKSLRKIKHFEEAVIIFDKLINICFSLFTKPKEKKENLMKIYINSLIQKGISFTKVYIIQKIESNKKFNQRGLECFNLAVNLDRKKEKTYYYRAKLFKLIDQEEEAKNDLELCRNYINLKQKGKAKVPKKVEEEKPIQIEKEKSEPEPQQERKKPLPQYDPSLSANKLLEIGDELLGQGDYAGAANSYNNIIQRDETNMLAHYKVALCEMKQLKPKEVVQKFDDIYNQLAIGGGKSSCVKNMKENIVNMIILEKKSITVNEIIQNEEFKDQYQPILKGHQNEKDFLYEQTCNSYQKIEEAKKIKDKEERQKQIRHQQKLQKLFKEKWESQKELISRLQYELQRVRILEQKQTQIENILESSGADKKAKINNWFQIPYQIQYRIDYVKAFSACFIEMENKQEIKDPIKLPVGSIPLIGGFLDSIQNFCVEVYQDYRQFEEDQNQIKIKKLFTDKHPRKTDLEIDIQLIAIGIVESPQKKITLDEDSKEDEKYKVENKSFFDKVSNWFTSLKDSVNNFKEKVYNGGKEPLELYDSEAAKIAVKDVSLLRVYLLAKDEHIEQTKKDFFNQIKYIILQKKWYELAKKEWKEKGDTSSTSCCHIF